MNIKIRLAYPEDTEALVALEHSIFDPTLYHQINKRQFRYLLTKANAEIWVAEAEGRILSGMFILLFRKNALYGRLYSIGVKSEYQGGEVGKALFDTAEKRLRDKGLEGMIQEVRADKKHLIERYTKRGYQIYAKKENYYPDNCACIRLRRLF